MPKQLTLDIVWIGLFRKELLVEELHGQGVQLVLHGQANPNRQVKTFKYSFKIILNEVGIN